MTSRHNQHPFVLFFSGVLNFGLNIINTLLKWVLLVIYSVYNVVHEIIALILNTTLFCLRVLVLMCYLFTLPVEWLFERSLKFVKSFRPNYQLVKTALIFFVILPMAFTRAIIIELRQQVGRLLAVCFKFVENIFETILNMMESLSHERIFPTLQPLNIKLWLQGFNVSFITRRLTLMEEAYNKTIMFSIIRRPERSNASRHNQESGEYSWISLYAFMIADGLMVCIQLVNILLLDWVNILFNIGISRIEDAERKLANFKKKLKLHHDAFCEKMFWPSDWVDTWLAVLFYPLNVLLTLIKVVLNGLHQLYLQILEVIKIPLLTLIHSILSLSSVLDAHFPCHELIQSNRFDMNYPADSYYGKWVESNVLFNEFGIQVDPEIGIEKPAKG